MSNEKKIERAIQDAMLTGEGSILMLDPKVVSSLRSENAKLRELVKWAIDYVYLGADGAINTDHENEWLAKARELTKGDGE